MRPSHDVRTPPKGNHHETYLHASRRPAARETGRGERYVVFNLPAEGETGFRSRETLVIGVSRPGELAPARIWRVQDRTAPDSPTAFHYPCAIEHEGRLLVLYTTGRTTPRQCELAIIPIASLQLKDR